MDLTQKDEEFAHVSSPFDVSRLFESTPKSETDRTSHLYNSNSKKRKVHHGSIRGRKLDSLMELSSANPQASSTLNESLSREFENIQIQQTNYFNIDDYDGPASKFLKTNGCVKIVTPPSTPEAHCKTFDCTPRKASSFQKCSSAPVPSPFKEQHELLYPNLKPLEPQRKPLTPKKFKLRIKNKLPPVAKDQYKNLADFFLKGILNNTLVMGHIFGYLSDGDLFRVSMVSQGFKDALCNDRKASLRCGLFRECHKKNKENYKITPPSSPESQSMFPEGSISPNSRHFADFIEIGHTLKFNQTLIKCPKCGKPSVVEDCIAQCQEVNLCGYNFCQKCDSFSFRPEGFYDRCRGLTLSRYTINSRPRLEDLTNSSPDFNVSSILDSTTENQYHSSGYFSGSGYDTSHTPKSVKRNLTSSFDVNDSQSKPTKALLQMNRSLNNSSARSVKREEKKRLSGNVVPIVKSVTVRKRIEEPSSPPRVKLYSACSKESKRNLKRLTR